MNEAIYQQLEGILIKRYGLYPDDIHNAARLKEDLGLDSLDTIELSMEVEKRFNVRIDDKDFVAIKNIEGVVSYIEERVEEQRPVGKVYGTSVGHED